jgi:hypothetical protein
MHSQLVPAASTQFTTTHFNFDRIFARIAGLPSRTSILPTSAIALKISSLASSISAFSHHFFAISGHFFAFLNSLLVSNPPRARSTLSHVISDRAAHDLLKYDCVQSLFK